MNNTYKLHIRVFRQYSDLSTSDCWLVREAKKKIDDILVVLEDGLNLSKTNFDPNDNMHNYHRWCDVINNLNNAINGAAPSHALNKLTDNNQPPLNTAPENFSLSLHGGAADTAAASPFIDEDRDIQPERWDGGHR